jgi:hypothetical protein
MLGRHFNGCEKIHLSLRTLWGNRPMSRLWWPHAILAHTLKMERDGSFDSPKSNINCLPGRNAPGKVGHRGSPITIGIFVNTNQVLEFSHRLAPLSPAWRNTEANVPFGMSSPK